VDSHHFGWAPESIRKSVGFSASVQDEISSLVLGIFADGTVM